MTINEIYTEVSGKKFLRAIWVVQLGIITVVSIVVLFAFPARMSAWMLPLPYLIGATVIEGGAAFGGASLKRWTEKKK